MTSQYSVSHVEFSPATQRDVEQGLLGFVVFRLGPGLLIDGATLRRSLTGRLGLAFPRRKDRAGRRHYAIRPIDDGTREDLEAQVLSALRAQGVLP